MIKLNSIKKELRCGKVVYVLPGRHTTDCAKHAKKVLEKIQYLTARAEKLRKAKKGI